MQRRQNSNLKEANKGTEIPVIIKDSGQSFSINDKEVPEKQEEKKETPGQRETVTDEGAEPEKTYDKMNSEEKIAYLEEQVKRLSAEFENFRRRQEKRFEDSLRFATENVVSEFIPVVDSITMARNMATKEHDEESLLKGIEMIGNQLSTTLEKLGVEKVKSVGEPFDTEFHHAAMAEDTDEHPDGTVLDEFQTGYTYKGRVIRPAMVKVSRNG